MAQLYISFLAVDFTHAIFVLRCKKGGAGTGNPAHAITFGNHRLSGVPPHMSKRPGAKSVGACVSMLPAPAPAPSAREI